MTVLLKVALNTVTGDGVLAWLKGRNFKVGEVNGMIPIEKLPKDMKLRDQAFWPVIISTEYFLEDKVSNGPDIVADINPETGEMNIRDKYWKGER